MNLAATLPVLLGLAWLLPLVSFALIVFFGPRMGKHGRKAAWVATGAILTGFVLSVVALIGWVSQHPVVSARQKAIAAANESGAVDKATAVDKAAASEGTAGKQSAGGDESEPVAPPAYYSGEWYTVAVIGPLKLTIGYYIDALTIVMFAMITLIATCIHFYASGYMHDELHDVTDHEVTLSDGHHLQRHGRYPRFFQYFSLFCFSMLGLVIAGNIFMVFVFWELVGICSYFLIGFYYERKSASNAGNKAFIVNRVGDFGMIIGLMALWGTLGTFAFGDSKDASGKIESRGIFSLVRAPENNYALKATDRMVRDDAGSPAVKLRRQVLKEHAADPRHPTKEEIAATESEVESELHDWRDGKRVIVNSDGSETPDPIHYGHRLLLIAGLGIFCGCVGKSAQFPLHVWLPDAMEGPTPVSALVHSATMVAAGVYLVGRFYPVFTPEVLLVIAIIGCITLALAATIAITAVDIKRVLAYSTVSQLGYMMLALGVGGWLAGLFHLITHAFFKSLLFLCSGSVIHACHTNDMTKMGGLRKKMPWTAYTMLVGCLAIIGGGIPFLIGLSGYYSKDSIIAQTLSFKNSNPNPLCGVFFFVAAAGASVTAFYMFRLWYMTFVGAPRDHHVHDHVHESPKVMYIPLVVLAVFAVCIGWPIFGVPDLLEQARPAGTAATINGGVFMPWLVHPAEHLSHEVAVHISATMVASTTALAGFLLATVIYAWKLLNPDEICNQFRWIYRLLWNKWYFDELYQTIFVRPVMFVSRRVADFDKQVIDPFINGCALAVRSVSVLDDLIDRLFVDGLVNATARWIHSTGLRLRGVQTGRLRQYVVLIVVGTVGLFILISFFWNSAWGASSP
ncbi:MAG TPA: NADH-quinone oxidoreductase subunit L [Pirellulales bacterium]|nr:NADH-quinone oxidoreductase subunit L [Pirellulales bacterium]